jgi:hypothetical protein
VQQLDAVAASNSTLTQCLLLVHAAVYTVTYAQLAHLSRDGKVIGQYPSPLQLSSDTGTLLDGIQNVVGGTTDTLTGLNKQATHGITYTADTPKPLIITSDFIEPLSTLTIAGVLNPGGLKYRVSGSSHIMLYCSACFSTASCHCIMSCSAVLVK